jgi:hypothetical protein
VDEPSVSSIARLCAHGPNAEKIQRVVARFHALTPQERELLLFSMDIEEGILPAIHPGGRASRRTIHSDARLIAVGDDVAYGDHVSAVLGAATTSTEASPPAAPGAQAEAAETTRASRGVGANPAELSIGAVVAQDELAMAIWFRQFVLQRVNQGQQLGWFGAISPLRFLGPYQIAALYQPDALAPLAIFVQHPPIHPQAPHRYDSGALCTFFPTSGSWIRGREDDDVVELLRFAIIWLLRYECWRNFNTWWPGAEVPHDPGWMLANVRDEDVCPFHAPRRHWGECCKPRYVAILEEQCALAHGIIPKRR